MLKLPQALVAAVPLFALGPAALKAQAEDPLFLHQDVEKVAAGLSLSVSDLENGIWLEGVLERSYATVESSILDAIATLGSATTPTPVLLNVSPSGAFVADLVYSRDPRLSLERFTGTIDIASTSRVFLGRELPRGGSGRRIASVQGSIDVDRRHFRLRPVRSHPGLIAIEEMDMTRNLFGDDSWAVPDVPPPPPPWP